MGLTLINTYITTTQQRLAPARPRSNQSDVSLFWLWSGSVGRFCCSCLSKSGNVADDVAKFNVGSIRHHGRHGWHVDVGALDRVSAWARRQTAGLGFAL